MDIIPTPHDRLFRHAMSIPRVAEEFFTKHLSAEILSKIDLKTLKLCPQTYVDEELKLSQVDVLFKVDAKDESLFLYCLCEHQSTPDRLLPFRLYKYNGHIWDDYVQECEKMGKKDIVFPLISNLVFYNGKKPYCYSLDFKDLFKSSKDLMDEFFCKPPRLIDSYRIPDEDERGLVWTGTMEFFMKNARKRDFLNSLKNRVNAIKLIELEGGESLVIALAHYGINVVNASYKEEFVKTLKQGLSKELRSEVVTIAEKLRQDGLVEGIQKGRQEGRQEGECRLFLAMLKRKFTHIPEQYMELLQHADENSFLRWGERIIYASTLNEVFTA